MKSAKYKPRWPAGERARWLAVSGLLAVCGLALALRCLHLLADDHYFIVSPDSHYFHRMADLLVHGETYFYPTHERLFPITMFSGFTYPLAAVARALAILTPASAGNALELSSKLLPPLIGVATTIVLYLAMSRLYGRTVGLLSAFASAVVTLAIAIQAAGYLDRDPLSILLIVCGVFLFYILTDKGSLIGRSRLGWILCAVAVVAIEGLLYLQWGFLGPAILLAILGAFYLVQLLNHLLEHVIPGVLAEEDPVRMAATMARRTARGLPDAVRRSPYRVVVLIVAFNAVAIAINPGLFAAMYASLTSVIGGTATGQQTVAELRGIGASDILAYRLLLIPTIAGIYIGLKRRSRADLLVLAWFGILFLAGLFSRRLFLYAVPAVCILSGLGLAPLLDWRGVRSPQYALSVALTAPRVFLPYLRIAGAFLLILVTILVSASFAYSFASTPPVSADTEWYEALTWMRENTPEEAVILTWWDYGYWIMDIANRTPVVDNGRHPQAVDNDIARVYCATDDAEAVEIAGQYGAGYLVFSQLDTRLLPLLSQIALNTSYGDGASVPDELKDSLYARSFSDVFQSDAGITRVYQSGNWPDSSVVILALP